MSVDLFVDAVRPTRVTLLLPQMATVLSELLGTTTVPRLVVERFADGQRQPVVTDQVGIDDAPMLLISISGEIESVGLVGRSDYLAVTMSGPRSSLQYALGAAIAITLAREFGAGIWDDRKFFGDEEHTSPETLLRRLKVAGHHEDYRGAAERITWGPPADRDAMSSIVPATCAESEDDERCPGIEYRFRPVATDYLARWFEEIPQ